MTLLRALVTLLSLCQIFSVAAHAADPRILIGKWIETFANGSGMVTEFTSSTIISYPVDQDRKATGPPTKGVVTYRDIDNSTIEIDFEGHAGILVMIKDPQTIILDFPGLAAHRLTKIGP